MHLLYIKGLIILSPSSNMVRKVRQNENSMTKIRGRKEEFSSPPPNVITVLFKKCVFIRDMCNTLSITSRFFSNAHVTANLGREACILCLETAHRLAREGTSSRPHE